MTSVNPRIDSSSTGDPARHLVMEELERRLRGLEPAPRDRGSVRLLVRRSEGGRRETPGSSALSIEEGLPGDAWGRRPDRNVEAQLAVGQFGIAQMIANGQPLGLFGDQLFLDLDLSRDNLPAGSRLRAGGAILEVTPKPHNGCQKYRARFGADALRFVSHPDRRHRNFRGIYLAVITEGLVSVGDTAEVLLRTHG